MGKRKIRDLTANSTGISWRTVVGKDYRFAVPKSARHHVKVGAEVQVTVKPVEEKYR
ncbi:MAG: hypothetical protein HWN68_08305 [Desulfobacterales bacterium]|nr:hypothetical protein [Desulfobacterales bacterium]